MHSKTTGVMVAVSGGGGGVAEVVVSALGPVPVLFAVDDRTVERVLEFFVAQIRNENTRKAYARAASRFSSHCEELGVELGAVTPNFAAGYIERLGGELTAATVKQHLAALRRLCDWLVTGQTMSFNPFSSVRGPKHVMRRGKTPVLYEDDARKLLDSIDTNHVVGLRDKAILAVMTYSFARVGAVVRLKVKDYRSQNRKATLALHEKGGKWIRVPVHHKAAEALDAYIEVAGIADEADGALFRSTRGRTKQMTDRGVDRGAILQMIKRRATDAGLPPDICNHTFRASGITNYLANGGTLETAAAIAGHSSTKTTQLYNRNSEEVSVTEIERIQI